MQNVTSEDCRSIAPEHSNLGQRPIRLGNVDHQIVAYVIAVLEKGANAMVVVRRNAGRL